ncbi:hypothetical protein ACFPZ0_05235 [Streptomonospora nanhaiensis]|uniref:Uncharacterized protein n=1 Tax=Streptomonospora nanhaiensis TaxID=1323731 RepID=A0A853BJ29_9ACTN|nr:hypothetical protein [Streptomonospora nanhaiensis]MBV2365016.1 hypothetical protein [Streptomonospora nanhaiensis]MBX9389097.1 hypothetical protein [Streptomonospora nanhaiensis]NYI94526.1 hypothetical protein [Streptomonospora nanhaiensis]
MPRPWEADESARLKRRLGKSPAELGNTDKISGCPDIWELENGDIAVIGRDLTAVYADGRPGELKVDGDERVVVIPRNVLIAAKTDIPDA